MPLLLAASLSLGGSIGAVGGSLSSGGKVRGSGGTTVSIGGRGNGGTTATGGRATGGQATGGYATGGRATGGLLVKPEPIFMAEENWIHPLRFAWAFALGLMSLLSISRRQLRC
jgi:hypothetical protein